MTGLREGVKWQAKRWQSQQSVRYRGLWYHKRCHRKDVTWTTFECGFGTGGNHTLLAAASSDDDYIVVDPRLARVNLDARDCVHAPCSGRAYEMDVGTCGHS